MRVVRTLLNLATLLLRMLERGFASPRTLLPLLGDLKRALRNGDPARIRRSLKAYASPRTQEGDPDSFYPAWAWRYSRLSEADRGAIRRRIEGWASRPRLSILLVMQRPREEWLRQSLRSVLNQLYPSWDLSIVLASSAPERIVRAVRETTAGDPRCRMLPLPGPATTATLLNRAMESAAGEFCARLGDGDTLSEDALYRVAEAIAADPRTEILYSDEDQIDGTGRPAEPMLKPDWSADLAHSVDFLSRLGVFRASRLRDLGGFREGYEGAEVYDLALRMLERTGADCIGHLPHVLYHARAMTHPGANLTRSHAQALRDHVERSGLAATVEAAGSGAVRTVYRLPPEVPTVALIMPFRDRVDLLRRAVEGILRETDYPNLELRLVDNDSRDPETLAYLRSLTADRRVRVLRHPGEFNYSALNNRAARAPSAAVVGFINSDVRVISPQWLLEMVRLVWRPEVGVVGALLYYPDDTVQHAGIVLGMTGVAGHPHRGLGREKASTSWRTRFVRDVSAVTGACMLLRRQVFDEAGGFDEEGLPVAFNDVDLCLRIRRKGYRILWTPRAELYHVESATRGRETAPRRQEAFAREIRTLRQRWSRELAEDPFYNPNLSVESEAVYLSFPPRVRKPWRKPFATGRTP